MSARRETLKFLPSAQPRRESILRAISSAVEHLGNEEGWEEPLAFKVHLVLEELATNIIDYGGEAGRRYPGIEIDIATRADDLIIEISDDGRPFDPLNDAPPPPVIDENTEIAPVGGFGIHLVRNMTDSMSYRYVDGRNRLTMTARPD